MTVLANPPTALDAIFELRSTTAIADTGFKVGGVDLSVRYEALASGTAAAATGLLVAGDDLNTKFCAKGSAALSWSTPTYVNLNYDVGAGIPKWPNTAIDHSALIMRAEAGTIIRGNAGASWITGASHSPLNLMDYTQILAWARNAPNGRTAAVVGGFSDGKARTMYSDDGGNTWVGNGILTNDAIMLFEGCMIWDGTHFVAVYLAGNQSKCTRSTDGVTWSTPVAVVGAGISRCGNTLKLFGSTIYASGYQGTVCTSTDHGATWSGEVTIFPSAAYVCDMIWDGGTRLVAISGNDSSGFYKAYSDNMGASWTTSAKDTADDGVHGMLFYNNGRYIMVRGLGFTGVNRNFRYYLSGDGITWTLKTTPATHTPFYPNIVHRIGNEIVILGRKGDAPNWEQYVTRATI